MTTRPEFNTIKSYEEFEKYYWYREELCKICKSLGIDASGTKQELNHNIKEYFAGIIVKKKKKASAGKKQVELSLDAPLLKCGFSFNNRMRSYFSELTGIDNFKFHADMVATWRKVKEEKDETFTIQDMLDVYYHQSDYAKWDNSSCQWNQFLKDFCADERNAVFDNKLKAASVLWGIVRNSTDAKVYSYSLVENNWEQVKEFCSVEV